MIRIASIIAIALSISACGTPDVNEGMTQAEVIEECTYVKGQIVENVEAIMYWGEQGNSNLVEASEKSLQMYKETFAKHCNGVKL